MKKKIKLFSEIPYIRGEGLILRKLEQEDAPGLQEMVSSDEVYKYLPTFLFEKKYDDVSYVISRLYDECFKESIILGIFRESDGMFCGLAELYGYRDPIHKISVGYRLLEKCWGQGIATRTLRLLVDYLYKETDIEIITASTMLDNHASAKVLTKNGFTLVVHASDEDWGFEEMIPSDKWIR